MEWNVEKIEEIVEFINKELSTGRTMVNIEREEFGENERVIHKRLVRKKYKKINNQYVRIEDDSAANKKTIEKKESKKIKKNKSLTNVIQPTQSFIMNGFNESDINSLKELITLVEPLKSVIQEYNKSITREKYIEAEPIEIHIDRKNLSGNVKQIGFRIDETILEEWKEFIKNYDGEYKVQDLVGEALRQFIYKYSK